MTLALSVDAQGRFRLTRPVSWVIAGAVFIFAFAVRLLSEDYLLNDHFMHLAWSRQILAGDLPVRDFVDPGMPLSYMVSAAAQMVFGPTELAEILLCSASLALAAALSVVLATRLSGSVLLGLSAGALQVVIGPRLYAYPRLLIPVVALWVFWAYVRRPDTRRRWLLAGLGVVAFLFRHDYGLAVATGALVLLATVHQADWRVALRQIGSCAGVAVILLLPWLLFWQLHGGLVPYLSGGVSFAVGDKAVGSNWGEGRQPWFSRQLAPPPSPPRSEIGVRWAEGMTEADIAAAASRLQLVDARHEEDQVWRYVLVDPDPAKVGALLADERVLDTSGIDRGRGIVVGGTWGGRVTRAVSSVGVLRDLGFFHRENAVPWLYYLFWMMPFLAFSLVMVNGRRPAPQSAEAPFILGAAALCVMTNFLFLRDPLAVRLADATAVTGVLGVWAIAQLRHRLTHVAPGAGPVRDRARQLGFGVVVALLTIVTLVAAAELGSFGRVLVAARWTQGPSRAVEHVGEHIRDLGSQPPIDRFGPPGSQRHALGQVARYVRDCTDPSDRLLVTWFAPELYFYTERRFAAGLAFLNPGFFSSERDQRLALSRLVTQTVPIVLVAADRYEGVFRSTYPLLYDYLTRVYGVAVELELGESSDPPVGVLVSKHATPTGTHPTLGLPCFRSS